MAEYSRMTSRYPGRLPGQDGRPGRAGFLEVGPGRADRERLRLRSSGWQIFHGNRPAFFSSGSGWKQAGRVDPASRRRFAWMPSRMDAGNVQKLNKIPFEVPGRLPDIREGFRADLPPGRAFVGSVCPSSL